MKKVEFLESYHSWGVYKDELFIIDFEKKFYARIQNGATKDTLPLPDDLLLTLQSFFEPIYNEFPSDQPSIDAPIYTLTIDDKNCTRIAIEDDYCYAKVSKIFEVFKKNL